LKKPLQLDLKAGTELSGVLRHRKIVTPAVVIAEGWPSWLEILPAIGFQDVKVWCQEVGLLTTYFDELHNNCIFDELTDLSQISKFRKPILFVLGSRSFVKRIEAQFRHLRIWVSISANNAGGKWEKVSKQSKAISFILGVT
jgi:hypothetical protein